MAVQEAVAQQVFASRAQRRQRSPWSDALHQLFRNRVATAGGVFILALLVVAVFAPVLAPYGYAETHFQDNYALPGPDYPLGADYLGRDILSRTIYGARVSLAVAFVAATVSLVVGVAYGTISGYAGGWVDNLMMRIVDFLYGLPVLIVVILMQVFFKAVSRRGEVTGLMAALVRLDTALGGLFFVFLALGLLNWIGMARIARGQVLSYKEREFVEAARAIGVGTPRVLFRHLLPNILGPCIVAETLSIPGYIMTEAFLSYIGLGANPPTPSWGIMINEGFQGIRSYPHVILVPATALTLTVLAFNFLGDGLRDAFDPRLRE
ncbi:MAG: ABC transporter permease [Anaerolineae bacterium]|nr:ABC transporter permease [Anaerolineae bacterium]